MSEKLNEQENYILHTAIAKITGLEKRTTALEENQQVVPTQSDTPEVEGDRMSVQEILSIQKENSAVLRTMAEEAGSNKTQLISLSEKLKIMKSTNEISSAGTSNQLEELKKIVLNSPRQVLQEKRILLFSEYNAREYLTTIKHIVVAFLCYFLLKYLVSCLFHLA